MVLLSTQLASFIIGRMHGKTNRDFRVRVRRVKEPYHRCTACRESRNGCGAAPVPDRTETVGPASQVQVGLNEPNSQPAELQLFAHV